MGDERLPAIGSKYSSKYGGGIVEHHSERGIFVRTTRWGGTTWRYIVNGRTVAEWRA